MKEIFLYGKSNFSLTVLFPNLFTNFKGLIYAAEIEPNEPTQKLFDSLFTDILATGTSEGKLKNVNDTIIVSSFNPNDYRLDMTKFYRRFDINFFNAFKFFKSKENLQFDSMFDVLDKTFDISPIYLIGKNVVGNKENENDKFVSVLFKNIVNNKLNIIDNHYKSFPNGASFFVTYPLHRSLAYLLRNDEMCRVKIAKFLSLKQFQSLRVRLGIATLKKNRCNYLFT